MTISQLLTSMCSDLADADVNAIRKARGFSARETTSRDSFASFLVSSIGVQEVMQHLTQEEVIMLHLLKDSGEVDIPFFERLYGSAARPGAYYYGTYTQKFRPTFDAIKKNLVRKGLLIMAEIKLRGDNVQMERWRFALPPEFAPYLPPILEPKRVDQPGEVSDFAIRKKLLQLVGGGPAVPNDRETIHIHQGSIQLGQNLLSAGRLIEWQTHAWKMALGEKEAIGGSLDPVDAVRSLFAELNPGEWVPAKSLEPALKIYCFGGKIPGAGKVLQQGWELGMLSRLKIDTEFYYRLAPIVEQRAEESLPATIPWLQISAKRNAASVDLRLIPFEQLELLNLLMDLSVETGALLAAPNLVKLSRVLPSHRQSSLSHWLEENLPDYREALALVNERWGRTVLHENLLIARVRDLSLRVQLERELGPKMIVLSEYFIAFPQDSRPSVEKVLKKSGFVIKTVKA